MRCPNCQYEAIGQEPRECINCGYVFTQPEKSNDSSPKASDDSFYSEHNNLTMDDDDLGIESPTSFVEQNDTESVSSSTPETSDSEMVIGDTTPPNPYETNTGGQSNYEHTPTDQGNGSIKRLSDDELKKIEKNFYKNDSDLISQKEKSSLITKLEQAQQDEQPLFDNAAPVEPPAKSESEQPVDIKEAAEAIAATPKPKIAKKSRGIAYFYKNYIELVGSQTIHPDDELYINNREYTLKPKKIKPTYFYAGIGGIFLLCLIVIGSFFIVDTSSGQGSIVGIALDDYEQPYLTGANIRLVDLGKTVETNAQGFFKFEGIPAGSHRIQYIIDQSVISEDYITVTGDKTSMTLLRPNYADTDDNSSDDNYSSNDETTVTPPPSNREKPPVQQRPMTDDSETKSKTKQTTTTTTTQKKPPTTTTTTQKKKTTTGTKKNTPGKVTLAANVESAKLKIDGNVLGAGNLTYKNITPGTHKYSVSSDGYLPHDGTFKLNGGETKILAITLKPMPQGKKKKEYKTDDFYFSAQNAYKDGDYNTALKDIKQCIDKSPSNANAYYLRAQTYDRLQKNRLAYDDYIRAAEIYQFKKEFNEAITSYNNAIELYPKEIPGYLGRGNLYLNKSESLAALADFDKVIHLDKRNFFGYFGLGEARFRQEQYNKAIDNFKDARSLDKDNPLVHQYLMICYMYDNDYKNVQKSYEKFVEVATESERHKFETDRQYSAVMKIIKTQH